MGKTNSEQNTHRFTIPLHHQTIGFTFHPTEPFLCAGGGFTTIHIFTTRTKRSTQQLLMDRQVHLMIILINCGAAVNEFSIFMALEK